MKQPSQKSKNIKHKQRQQLPLWPTLGAEILETTETKSQTYANAIPITFNEQVWKSTWTACKSQSKEQVAI